MVWDPIGIASESVIGLGRYPKLGDGPLDRQRSRLEDRAGASVHPGHAGHRQPRSPVLPARAGVQQCHSRQVTRLA
jgi:hypothetical protein